MSPPLPNRGATHPPEGWTFLATDSVWWSRDTMIEPRSDRVTVCSPQTQHHCYQVIRTTRVHQSSRSSRMVTVQERVVRSRLQLGYSTPTSFINRYIFIFFLLNQPTNRTNDPLNLVNDGWPTWIVSTFHSRIKHIYLIDCTLLCACACECFVGIFSLSCNMRIHLQIVFSSFFNNN